MVVFIWYKRQARISQLWTSYMWFSAISYWNRFLAITEATILYNQFNSLRPRQNKRHFADDVFKCNFLNENVWIPVEISLKFLPKGPINNTPTLVQIMAWCRICDKPLSEPMITQFNDAYMQWVKFFKLLPHLPGANTLSEKKYFNCNIQITGFLLYSLIFWIYSMFGVQ